MKETTRTWLPQHNSRKRRLGEPFISMKTKQNRKRRPLLVAAFLFLRYQTVNWLPLLAFSGRRLFFCCCCCCRMRESSRRTYGTYRNKNLPIKIKKNEPTSSSSRNKLVGGINFQSRRRIKHPHPPKKIKRNVREKERERKKEEKEEEEVKRPHCSRLTKCLCAAGEYLNARLIMQASIVQSKCIYSVIRPDRRRNKKNRKNFFSGDDAISFSTKWRPPTPFPKLIFFLN